MKPYRPIAYSWAQQERNEEQARESFLKRPIMRDIARYEIVVMVIWGIVLSLVLL